MTTFTSKTTGSRYPQRLSAEKELIYSILDEALFCTVSYQVGEQPFAVPTSFVRKDQKLYIHGSVGSHFLREIEKGIPVCISVMLADAIVVAKSAYNHSVNYRSVIIFSNSEKVEDEELKSFFFQELTNKLVPNSWEYLRPMKKSEVNKTMLLSFNIEEASAKVRAGMPSVLEEDEGLKIWSGIIPFSKEKLKPIADPGSENIALPNHLLST